MNNLIVYKTLPEWDFNSLPKGFRKKHNTKAGTWAKLNILEGELRYDALDEQGQILESFVFDANTDTPFVEPQAWHKVEPLTQDLRCQLSFYCSSEQYYQKKYKLSATHSEVLEVINHIQAGKALDLGCGGGRNALFLQQQGFEVTAFDKNSDSINKLKTIIAEELLNKIQAFVADAQEIKLREQYDLIIATVVLMFLDAKAISGVINSMQTHTQSGGYNLIVCAIDSEDYPLSAHQLPFGFGFKPNELANYYQGWQIKKYNEDVGHLHRLDENGNPIALRFVTLIAQKP